MKESGKGEKEAEKAWKRARGLGTGREGGKIGRIKELGDSHRGFRG